MSHVKPFIKRPAKQFGVKGGFQFWILAEGFVDIWIMDAGRNEITNMS